MSVFEFNLLIKQHTLIPQSMVSLSNPCYQVGFCTVSYPQSKSVLPLYN